MSRRECVFWGWGEPGAGPSLPDHAAGFLRSELGVEGAVVSRPVALEEVRLRPPALARRGARAAGGDRGGGRVRDDAAARVGRCRGKSYLDLLRQRAGDCEDAPDAVVAPGSAAEVQAVLYACSEEGVAVVPFGGGTSVVGGLEPLRGRYDALVSLDLGRLEGIESLDERSHLAWLRGGTRLPEADHALAQRGFMLGHTPQSYEWATVGGCVATRSAGQSSTGHGRIDENVVALRCATPAGELATLAVPAHRGRAGAQAARDRLGGRAGRDHQRRPAGASRCPRRGATRATRSRLRGRLGGAAGARAGRDRPRRRPALRRGRDADVVRARRQRGEGARDGRGAARALRAGLRLGGHGDGGRACGGSWRRARCAARGRGRSARAPGEAWAATRYAGPHLRDDLLDRGVMVETLETATTWSNLAALRSAVTRALEGSLTAPLVLCHASHVYADRRLALLHRASPPRTATTRRASGGGPRRRRWTRSSARAARSRHHHAVGADHAPWLPRRDRPRSATTCCACSRSAATRPGS